MTATRRGRTIVATGLVAALVIALTTLGVARRLSSATAEVAFPQSREVTAWPFPWDSIWNMPIGAGADLVPANLPPLLMTADEDVLLLDAAAPTQDVMLTTASWDGNQTRCGSVQHGRIMHQNVPIPSGFSTEDYAGRTPNHSAALLLGDGETIVQTQPFHVCGAGGVAVSQFDWGTANIKTGDGIRGAHGGSGMSSIGGTIRVGELTPGGSIRHALKMNLDCGSSCFYSGSESDGQSGYRWPALAADTGASGMYGGSNPSVQMGSLLALPPGFDVEALPSEPARIIARALRDYGAYVVDNTGWNVHALATEWSPEGRVLDEFEQQWGFSFDSDPVDNCPGKQADCRWMDDLRTVMAGLHVVEDNAPDSVGGAGSRLAPCAPAFSDGTGAPPTSCAASASAAAPSPAPPVTPAESTVTIDPTPPLTPAPEEAPEASPEEMPEEATAPLLDAPDASSVIPTPQPEPLAPQVDSPVIVTPVVPETTPTPAPPVTGAAVAPSESLAVPTTGRAPAVGARTSEGGWSRLGIRIAPNMREILMQWLLTSSQSRVRG